MDENYGSIDYSYLNIQDQEAMWDFAKMLFKSDSYILLPRVIRYHLVKYIVWV